MLGIQHHPSFVVAILLFQLVPGPGTLAILGATARDGVPAGMGAVLGTLLGDFVYMLAAVLGLAAVLAAYPIAFSAVRWFGIAYLIWIGLTFLRAASSDAQDAEPLPMSWRIHLRRAFANDFAKPQGLRHSLGIFRSGSATRDGVVFTLHRSTLDRPFSDSEIRISSVLQHHLFNLHHLYSRLEETFSSDPDPLEVAQRFGGLTHREVEITVLLCRRLSTSTIASKLLISRLTVYKHVENIFGKLGINSRKELLDRFNSRDSA
jgi:leucine efflux protein